MIGGNLQAGNVRLRLPAISFTWLSWLTIVRRAGLRYLVRVRDDRVTLDISETCTWDELSVARRHLALVSKTPLGDACGKSFRQRIIKHASLTACLNKEKIALSRKFYLYRWCNQTKLFSFSKSIYNPDGC